MTHAADNAVHADLVGWRRVWRHTGLRDVAFLTAEPCEGVSIQGLMAPVPDGDWAALDEREFAYDRIAEATVSHEMTEPVDVQVYAIPKGKHGAPSTRHPILLSYLDVVVQGYFREFGYSGVEDFFATTAGWDSPVLNDRAAPIYPRSQQLHPGETAMVDRALGDLPSVVKELK